MVINIIDVEKKQHKLFAVKGEYFQTAAKCREFAVEILSKFNLRSICIDRHKRQTGESVYRVEVPTHYLNDDTWLVQDEDGDVIGLSDEQFKEQYSAKTEAV